jgi:hypothetical protein
MRSQTANAALKQTSSNSDDPHPIRVLTLDLSPQCVVFGLYEVDPIQENLLFERAMGWTDDNNVNQAVKGVCQFARGYGRLDVVVCTDNGDCSLQAVETAARALYGVPVVLMKQSESEPKTGAALARSTYFDYMKG